jgi:dienelactone hydrolase
MVVMQCIRRWPLVALLAATAALAQTPTQLETPPLQEVFFPSADGTPLRAWARHPQGVAAGGTVVALHGCGGLYARGGPPRLGARHQAMADMLVAQGYNVVLPDSLTPRGETSLCAQPVAGRRVTQRERLADAQGALVWVAAQPWAAPGRIALLGWSHGGSAVLAATDASRPEVRSLSVVPVIAVAFYPGCGDALRRGWRPHVPLVLMLGEDDDWTPAAPCVQLGRAAGAEVNLYAGSHHGFDEPLAGVRHRPEVPNGVKPGAGVHVGGNPVAREAAYARLRQLLQQAFR